MTVAVVAFGCWIAGVVPARAAAAFLTSTQRHRVLVEVALVAVAAPAIAVAAGRAIEAARERAVDTGYVLADHPIAMSVLVGFAVLLPVGIAGVVDGAILGLRTDAAPYVVAGLGGDLPIQVGFVAVLGVVLPAAEEYLWRGLVQPVAVDDWGPRAGVAVAAAGFAAGRIALLFPALPVLTVLVLGLILGAVRRRYGTAASTVVNVFVSVPAATGAVLAARWMAEYGSI